MSDNPLMQQKTALDVSPVEEYTQKLELLESNDASLYDLQRRKANIERKRQDLDIDRKESNLDAVEELNQRIGGLLTRLTDNEVTDRVFDGIETGKDYNEAIKGVQSLTKIRDDMLDRIVDNSASGGKKKRIEVAFQAQGVQVAMRVETDE